MENKPDRGILMPVREFIGNAIFLLPVAVGLILHSMWIEHDVQSVARKIREERIKPLPIN